MALSRKEKRRARQGRERGERLRRPDSSEEPASSHEYNRAPRASKGDTTPPPSPIALRGDILRMLDAGTLALKSESDIINSAYKEEVRPRESTLRSYQNGTSEIYGEILEPLIDDIINQTALSSNSSFVDLGSGYGNVVMQMAVKTGCEARGIELRKELFDIAKDFQREVNKQAKAALFSCDRCTLLKGDFVRSTDIDEWIENANVMFVNGIKFDPATNVQLAERLGKMKIGAKLVFLHDWIEIRSNNDLFDHKVIEYDEDSVSWTAKGGQYYIATVVQDRKAKIERSRTLRKRSKTV